MNRFEKQLEKWNNGTLRGAQAKLAKILRVSTATVALWATGKRHPSKGSVSKMAQLFKLDIYHVARLFTPIPPYADAFLQPQSTSLRDEDSAPLAYHTLPATRAQKTVSLPLFTELTTQTNVAPHPREWWNIPATSAKGASFLFMFPQTKGPERILFIRPSTQWQHDTTMLARRGKTYHLVCVSIHRRTVLLTSPKGTALPVSSYKPVGVVTQQITDINARA